MDNTEINSNKSNFNKFTPFSTYRLSVDDMCDLISNLQLQEKYNRTSVLQIFDKLDTTNTGFIDRNELFDYLENLDANNKEHNYKELLEKFNQTVLSKSEKILFRLTKLRKKIYIQNDSEALEDINWIINNILDKDILEPDILDIHMKTQNEEDLGALRQYSNFQDICLQRNDLKTLNSSKTLKDLTFKNNNMSSDISFVRKVNKEARNSLMSSFSPSKQPLALNNMNNKNLIHLTKFDLNIADDKDNAEDNKDLNYSDNDSVNSLEINLITVNNTINNSIINTPKNYPNNTNNYNK